MKWIDLFQYLNERANDFKNLGQFPWQEEVQVFDFNTLEYYSTDFIQMPDKKISFSVDTTQLEITNGS
jgi:hypothetical protein